MNPAAGEMTNGGRQRLAVWLLAAGQTVVWAGLFYSFAALLLSWESDLGWSKTDIAFGLTLALLVAAAAAPVSGRVIDAGGGRALLGGGALFGAGCLALLSQIQSQVGFLTLWALIGLAHASCLYEPCFALVTRHLGSGARAAITRISLCAGFASTIAFPLGAALADLYGWRGAVVVYAVCVAVIGAPLLIAGSTLLKGDGNVRDLPHKTQNRAAVRSAMGRREFWLIALAFPTIALNHGVLLNHIIPILVDRGLTEVAAVTVAALIGPAQVVGRLLMMRFERRISAMTVTVVAFLGLCIACFILFMAGSSLMLAFAFAATQGAAYGVTYILKPVVTAEALGRTGFGAISGLLAMPNLAGFAVAPFIGAALAQSGGYAASITFAGCMAVVGFALICWLAMVQRRDGITIERSG